MKPSEALLAVIDDSEFVQTKIPVLAESLGARVVAQAQTPEEADAHLLMI